MPPEQQYNKLMIVAHPDDESIFGGGALLAEPGWKVICLTNGDNELRSQEFHKAMEFVGAVFEIWRYPDELNGSFDENQLKRELERELQSRPCLRLVTHNLHGEYGHSQHKALSRIIHSMQPDNLYVFATCDEPLSNDILNKKLELLRYYPSQSHVILGLETYVKYERIVHASLQE